MTSPRPDLLATSMLGFDHALYWHYKNPTVDSNWSGLVRSAGVFVYEPVVISRQFNIMTAFVVNTDDHSLQMANMDWNTMGTYEPWKKIGGQAFEPPAVANQKGTLHTFHIGKDRALYYKSWDGATYTPTEGFERLDGVFVHQPTAISAGAEQVSVFVVGMTDGCLYHYNWDSNSGWRPAQKLPGIWVGRPVAISDQEGSWDVFGLNINGNINHLSSRLGQQSHLKTFTGIFKSLDVVSWGPGRIDIFAVALNSSTYHKTWEKNSWGGWEDLKGVSVKTPKAVCYSPRKLAVLIIGSDSKMYVNIRNPAIESWQGWFTPSQGLYLSSVG